MNNLRGHAQVRRKADAHFHVLLIKTDLGELAAEHEFHSLDSLLGFLSDLKVDHSDILDNIDEWRFEFDDVEISVIERWSKS